MGTRRIVKGDRVRFRERKITLYRQIYGIDLDEVFTVVHEEPRHGRRVLYLSRKDTTDWLPAYPSALLFVGRAALKAA